MERINFEKINNIINLLIIIKNNKNIYHVLNIGKYFDGLNYKYTLYAPTFLKNKKPYLILDDVEKVEKILNKILQKNNIVNYKFVDIAKIPKYDLEKIFKNKKEYDKFENDINKLFHEKIINPIYENYKELFNDNYLDFKIKPSVYNFANDFYNIVDVIVTVKDKKSNKTKLLFTPHYFHKYTKLGSGISIRDIKGNYIKVNEIHKFFSEKFDNNKSEIITEMACELLNKIKKENTLKIIHKMIYG